MIESEKPPAALKKRKLSSSQWRQPNSRLGQTGENRAVAHLISNNYFIQARNILFPSGEIDVVAIDVALQELAFVEVKTRTHTHFGHPSTALNWKKKRALQSAVLEYLRRIPSRLPYRFDLIIVTPRQIIHYTNVTI